MIWSKFKSLPRTYHQGMIKYSSKGSVTMEYIVVSGFAILVSISAVTWLGKVIKERIDHIASKMGSDSGEFNVDLESLQ